MNNGRKNVQCSGRCLHFFLLIWDSLSSLDVTRSEADRKSNQKATALQGKEGWEILVQSHIGQKELLGGKLFALVLIGESLPVTNLL